MQLVLAYDSQYKPTEQLVMRKWCLLDEKHQVILQGENNTPQQIAEAARQYVFSTTVLIISPDVNVLKIARPAGSLAKIRQALPYLLEEHLVEDVAELHFTILNQVDHESLIVAIINRDLLQTCVNALTHVKLIPETVLPIWLVLPPANAQQWFILMNEDYIWARTGQFTGFSIEKSAAETLLFSLYNLTPPQSIQWITADNTTIDVAWSAESTAKNIEILAQTCNSPETWLSYLGKTLPEASTINLLHSEFSIKQQLKGQKRLWKMAAILVGSIFGVWYCGLLGQYLYLSWGLYKQNQEIEQTYQTIFPGTKPIGNPRSAVDRELVRISQGAAGNDFLSLLLRAGDILQQFPQIQIIQIVYANNRLEVSITTDNFSRLRQLDEEFEKLGLPIKQEDASSTQGVVQARLVIG